jgi:hypothetical protein
MFYISLQVPCFRAMFQNFRQIPRLLVYCSIILYCVWNACSKNSDMLFCGRAALLQKCLSHRNFEHLPYFYSSLFYNRIRSENFQQIPCSTNVIDSDISNTLAHLCGTVMNKIHGGEVSAIKMQVS